MRIQFKKTLFGDYGRAARDEVKDVDPEVGKSLVDRGLAVEVGGKAKVGRKAPAKPAAKKGKTAQPAT